MKEYTFHPVANIFPLVEGKEFAELVKDIKDNGLYEPIWLWQDQIIDGRNRYRACSEAGIEPKYRLWEGNGSLLTFVLSLNLKRRHLDQGQKALVGLKALPFAEEEARKRQLSTLKQGDKPPVTAILQERDKGEAAEKVGKLMGVSQRYVYDAKKIQETSPELVEEILKGNRGFAEVVKENKKNAINEKITLQKEEIKKLTPINGNYNLIVVDPPWQNKIEYDPEYGRGAVKYPQMTTEEIENIKLPMDSDCVIFLWTIDCYLHEALHILDKWGLDRKGTIIWVKDKIGLGKWLRNQHEYCFLAFRGNPVFDGRSISTILNAPRNHHSEKPDEFYQIVEKTCPYKKRLDYFARKQREGWDVYGDEVQNE